MNKQEAKLRLAKLRQEIDHHRYLYHVLDKQEISDAALDSLKDELNKLEDEFPELITADSPTQRVAGKALAKFQKVSHKVKQWSFNDAFTLEDIRAFDRRVKKMLGEDKVEYSVELKIDGLHIVLDYQDGLLLVAATRGDGLIGENVTHTARTVESIPLKLRRPASTIVEGEIFMSKSVFLRLN